MIQRKQSIFLLLTALIALIFSFAFDWSEKIIGIIFYLASALLSLLSIFLYKNRKLQINLNWLNILLNILLIGYLVYVLLNLSGGLSNPEKGIGTLGAFISIGLLLIANRYIKKDEELVKSIDRFR